jgi:hypothetical protein
MARARFRVAFDGEWQGEFDDLTEAVEWAREVSLTGRKTWVIERKGLSHRFRAGFPEDRANELEKEWHDWRSHRAAGPRP